MITFSPSSTLGPSSSQAALRDAAEASTSKTARQNEQLITTNSRSLQRVDASLSDSGARRVVLSTQVTQVSISYDSLSSKSSTPDVYSPQSIKTNSVQGNTQNKAANNILSFVSQRLEQDAAGGATKEELQSRLQAGLEGFLEGFADAKEQLEGLGQLEGKVKHDTQQTYRHVLDGITKLAKQYGLANPVADVLADLSPDELAIGDLEKNINDSAFNGSHSSVVAQEKGFEFALTTAEGDTVRIKAQSTFIDINAKNSSHNSSNYLQASASNNQFVFEVDGDLNQDELSAINQLLNDVGSLSQTFYAGDIESAFNQAVDLNIDTDQIVTFSLNLSFTQYTKVESNFLDTANPSIDTHAQKKGGSIDNQVARMADFIQQLEDIRLRGKAINLFEGTLEKLFDQTLGEETGARQIVTQMLEALQNSSNN